MLTRRTKKGFIWIPRPFTPEFMVKQEIIKNSTTYNVVTKMRYLEFNKPTQHEIGKFKIIIDNNAGTYTNLFEGGETAKFYLDMSSGTTKEFEGYIEDVNNTFTDRGYELEISGSQMAGKLLDITVTASFTDEAIEDILEEIVADFAPSDFSYDKATYPCSTKATINWSHKPFWECFNDLCKLAGYDGYVDNDEDEDNTYDFHFFEENSLECTLDAVVFKDNVIDIEGLRKDTIDVKNKIIVYGLDGLIVYTAEDASSISSYGIKEKIIRDDNITTDAEAKERANAELELEKEKKLKGRTKTWGMVYLNQGEKIWITIPPQKIHGQYKILNYKQKIDRDFIFTTEVDVQKPIKGIPHFFKERLKTELAHEKIENPNLMKFSYNFTFNDDTNCNHSNTETGDGKLRLMSGQTSGTMTSDACIATDNITQIEIRAEGKDLRGSTFDISVDNSISWDLDVSPDTLHVTTMTGKYLMIRANLRNTTYNVEIDSLAVLYK